MKKSKGRPIKDYPSKPYEPLSDIDQERLALFGAVSLAWNYLEGALDTTLGAATNLPEPMWTEVTSRIHGFDGKCALLKRLCEYVHHMPSDRITMIADTLGAAGQFKSYRDGIVHAKILHPESSIAPTYERKGAVGEALVTIEALRGLYERINWVRAEIECVLEALQAAAQFRLAKDEDEKQSAAQRMTAWVPRLLDYQHQRKSLPPLPEFPDEPQAPPAQEEPPAPQA